MWRANWPQHGRFGKVPKLDWLTCDPLDEISVVSLLSETENAASRVPKQHVHLCALHYEALRSNNEQGASRENICPREISGKSKSTNSDWSNVSVYQHHG
jgi:hypothetical protein